MSAPALPPELLDHIIDLLHDSRAALRNCCLVSRSWIPCTVSEATSSPTSIFNTEGKLESREIFPDPSTSPARYAKTLTIGRFQVFTAADAEAGGWISSFSYVERLEMMVRPNGSRGAVSLLPFCGFSPVLKSLCLDFYALPPSQIFDLILSFPLLEDLSVAMGGSRMTMTPPDRRPPTSLRTSQ